MADCIFCRIAAKEIPATAVYEDDSVIAFKDLEPQAPVHVLIIPKKHIKSLLGLTQEDRALVAHIHVDVVPQLAKELGLAEKASASSSIRARKAGRPSGICTFISWADVPCNGRLVDG